MKAGRVLLLLLSFFLLFVSCNRQPMVQPLSLVTCEKSLTRNGFVLNSDRLTESGKRMIIYRRAARDVDLRCFLFLDPHGTLFMFGIDTYAKGVSRETGKDSKTSPDGSVAVVASTIKGISTEFDAGRTESAKAMKRIDVQGARSQYVGVTPMPNGWSATSIRYAPRPGETQTHIASCIFNRPK